MAPEVPDGSHNETSSQHETAESGPARVVRAEDLFGEQREVWIELDGVRYRLRITRRGKLILQK